MMSGPLSQMTNQLDAEGHAHYQLPVGDQKMALNPLVGQRLTLRFTGHIACAGCGRAIKKSFQQGYCFPCTQRLAVCDLCIVKPELCHFAKGTCREPEWGIKHCMQTHYVYLANSSGLKVGITRAVNVPHRWIDQGATQALLVAKTATRRDAGLMEVEFAKQMGDKTNWRKMLQGNPEPLDLMSIRDQLLSTLPENLEGLINEKPYQIDYPVLHYPSKIVSLDLEKNAEISGILQGIKAQYLLFDQGVLNVRKLSGYHVEIGV
jgi:hypothetical protein